MTYNLGKVLVLPAITRRYSQSNGLKITAINKIRRVLGINEVLALPQPENFNSTSGRCFKCVEAIGGKKSYKHPAPPPPPPPYKAEREKLSNKLKTKC